MCGGVTYLGGALESCGWGYTHSCSDQEALAALLVWTVTLNLHSLSPQHPLPSSIYSSTTLGASHQAAVLRWEKKKGPGPQQEANSWLLFLSTSWNLKSFELAKMLNRLGKKNPKTCLSQENKQTCQRKRRQGQIYSPLLLLPFRSLSDGNGDAHTWIWISVHPTAAQLYLDRHWICRHDHRRHPHYWCWRWAWPHLFFILVGLRGVTASQRPEDYPID